ASRVRPGAAHPLTFKIMNGLASLCHQRGLFEEAEALFREVLEHRRATLDPDHPDTLLSLHNLGVHYRKCGEHAKAEPLLLEAATRAQAKLPLAPPYTRRFINSVAELYEMSGSPAEAAQWRSKLASAKGMR